MLSDFSILSNTGLAGAIGRPRDSRVVHMTPLNLAAMTYDLCKTKTTKRQKQQTKLFFQLIY